MLNYNRGWPVSDAREAGYREAMKAAGIEVQPDWVAYTPNILHNSAEATRALMTAKHPLTAIACANDVMAFGAKTYFDGTGLRVGEDIALTGYDDDTTSEFLGITSVRQPIDEVAAAAFEILLGGINRKATPDKQIVFSPTLIVRQSSARRR
jgi:LacI family transcriptional regulator